MTISVISADWGPLISDAYGNSVDPLQNISKVGLATNVFTFAASTANEWGLTYSGSYGNSVDPLQNLLLVATTGYGAIAAGTDSSLWEWAIYASAAYGSAVDPLQDVTKVGLNGSADFIWGTYTQPFCERGPLVQSGNKGLALQIPSETAKGIAVTARVQYRDNLGNVVALDAAPTMRIFTINADGSETNELALVSMTQQGVTNSWSTNWTPSAAGTFTVEVRGSSGGAGIFGSWSTTVRQFESLGRTMQKRNA